LNYQLLLLLGYSAGLIAFGLWTSRRTRRAADFFVAGRRLGPGLLFGTMLAANIGAGSTVGATGLGYRDGVAAWWWVGSSAVGTALLALWVGPALRRTAERLDLRTVGDYLEHRYGRSVRLAVASVLALASIAILAGQLIALAWVLDVTAGIPKALGCLLGGLVVTGYFSAGGLSASVRVNVVQLLVKAVGLGLAVPFVLRDVGGWGAVLSVRPLDSGYWDWGRNGGSGWPLLLLLGPAFAISPGLLQKVYGARDDAAARGGTGLTALALVFYAGVPPLLGIMARSRFPDLVSPELALPMLLKHSVPPIIGGLGLAAIFSAEMSAADAVLFMLSTSIAQDFYKRFLRTEASDARLLAVVRLTAGLSGCVAIALAVALPSVIGALSIFYTLLTVCLFVPIVGGLGLRQAGTAEALSAIGAGLVGALALYLASSGEGAGPLTPALVGTLAAAVAFLGTCLLRSPDGANRLGWGPHRPGWRAEHQDYRAPPPAECPPAHRGRGRRPPPAPDRLLPGRTG
jgi:SSS family solute:Na+ symporter